MGIRCWHEFYYVDGHDIMGKLPIKGILVPDGMVYF
jgi:hypothetical protein